MNLSAEEFMSLSNQLSDRDVKTAELEMQLQQVRQLLTLKEAENQSLAQRLAEMEQIHAATELENAYLKRYLWLSWSKIKSFLSHIHDIRLLAFLQTFMQKTVSEEMGAKALEVINEVVNLEGCTDIERLVDAAERMADKPAGETHNHFATGSNCQVFNDEVTGEFQK